MDIWVNTVAFLYKPSTATQASAPRRAAPVAAAPASPLSDWERVLYVGSVDDGQVAPPHPSTAIDEEPRAFTAWTSERRAAEPMSENGHPVGMRD